MYEQVSLAWHLSVASGETVSPALLELSLIPPLELAKLAFLGRKY